MLKPAKWILPLLLLGSLTGLARAEQLTREKALGFAAARSDAFLNLSSRFGAMSLGTNRTVADLLANDPATRSLADAALRGAGLVTGPQFDDSGLVHVVVELDTWTLPYDLRLKVRNLPRFLHADGLADTGAAAREDEMATSLVRKLVDERDNKAGDKTKMTDVADEVRAWADTNLAAEGQADVERTATKELARETARRKAMTAGYAALAKKVDALALDADITVQAFVQQHPEVRDNVNAALLRAQLVSETLNVQGTLYTVKLALPAQALLRPLKLGSFRTFRGTVLAADQIELARTNARADAEDNLLHRILALRVRSGALANELVDARQNMKKDLERLCRQVSTQQVQITEDGIVKVYAALATDDLPRELRDFLITDSPTRLEVVGGGLPAVSKKPDADTKTGVTPEKPDKENPDKTPKPPDVKKPEPPKKVNPPDDTGL